LLYQLKVKLLAELTGIASVNVENNQIVMRFRDDELPPDLPPLKPEIRIGKTGLWIAYKSIPNWQETILDIFQVLLHGEGVESVILTEF
jgi:hypothetical protein